MRAMALEASFSTEGKAWMRVTSGRARARSMISRPASVATIRADQSVAAEGAASLDLLLVVGDVAGGVERTDENGIASSAIEPADSDVYWDAAFELFMGELKSPLVAQVTD